MQSKPLGCFTTMGILAAGITAVVIVGVALIGGNELFSAGPLSAASSETSLGGVRSHDELSQSCSACHTPFWSEDHMRDRCLKCHTEIQAEIMTSGKLHSGLDVPNTCRSCHTEHKGAEAHITEYDAIRFLHNEVGFSLRAHQGDGNWTGVACLECHQETVREFKVDTCWTCHEQLDVRFMENHRRIFGQRCLACHDGHETYGKDFQHDISDFLLEGAHQSTTCEQCHAGDSDLDELRETPNDCSNCHTSEDVHEGILGTDCAHCHTTFAWDAATFDHEETSFSLDGKHVELTCEACHTGVGLVTISAECVSCHQEDDSHIGGLGNQCQACHQTTGWGDAFFDHVVTEFQLEDAHALLACNDCHAGIPLSEISATCYGCHLEEDAHDGTYGEQCEACHRPTTWQDITFDHALSKFPLTGAHVGLPCVQCHIEGRFQEINIACASCHADPPYHLGLFSHSCETCHSTSAWRPATFNQSHRFPINHGGRSSSCTTCHPNSLRNYTCYTCHEHNQAEIDKKHREEGIGNFGDCTRCHPTGQEEEGGDDD